ncbi:TPA: ORF1 protein [Bos taurus]|uniref:ORF1 protein n=1 Tax=Bos taurus TaxID=9913 RepID=Q27961_BOVIN|nr:ORF1 [Bos taurus]DAA31954.1 TPA: ORF1 protein [Bos taurus]
MTWGLFAPEHKQLLSGDLDEEIRVSPRFCPQQTLGSFIHSRVFQVSLKRGLIRKVIK